MDVVINGELMLTAALSLERLATKSDSKRFKSADCAPSIESSSFHFCSRVVELKLVAVDGAAVVAVAVG